MWLDMNYEKFKNKLLTAIGIITITGLFISGLAVAISY